MRFLTLILSPLLVASTTSFSNCFITDNFAAGTNSFMFYSSTLLAQKHFNSRDSIVVPSLANLNCPANISISMDFQNSQGSKNIAMANFLATMSDCPGCPGDEENESGICALVGARFSSVSQPLAIVTSVIGVPQTSATATSTELNDIEQYSTFTRTVPSDRGTAFAAASYFKELGFCYVNVLYPDDSYGTSYAQAFQNAFELLGCNVELFSIRISQITAEGGGPAQISLSGLDTAARGMAATGFTANFAVLYESRYPVIVNYLAEKGLFGDDIMWLFTDTVSSTFFFELGQREDEVGKAAAKVSEGTGFILAGAAIPGLDSYENFQKAWVSPPGGAVNFTAEVNSMLPLDNSTLPKKPTFFATTPPNSAALLYYDAVISVGLAACAKESWETYNLNDRDEDGRPILLQKMIETDFVGASGRVAFSSDTHERMITTIPYQVNNVRKSASANRRRDAIIIDIETSSLDTVLSSYTKEANFTAKESEARREQEFELKFVDVEPFVYRDGTTTPPVESYPPAENFNELGAGIRYAGWALGLFIVLLCALCLAWVWTNRTERIVRASQPEFLCLLALGVCVFCSALYPLSVDDQWKDIENGETKYCMMTIWLASYGFCLIFSALFSKIWRINKIFKQAAFSKVRVTRNDVLIPFIVMLSVITLLCGFMQGYGAMAWQRSDETVDKFGNVLYSSGKCKGNDASMKFVWCIVVFNVGVLLMALWQAYEARAITVEYSESTYIGYAMISMFQVFLVGIPLLFILNENAETFYFGCLAVIVGTCFTILGFLFIPKIRLLAAEKKKKVKEKEGGKDVGKDVGKDTDARATSGGSGGGGGAGPAGTGIGARTTSILTGRARGRANPSARSSFSNVSVSMDDSDDGESDDGLTAAIASAMEPVEESNNEEGDKKV